MTVKLTPVSANVRSIAARTAASCCSASVARSKEARSARWEPVRCESSEVRPAVPRWSRKTTVATLKAETSATTTAIVESMRALPRIRDIGASPPQCARTVVGLRSSLRRSGPAWRRQVIRHSQRSRVREMVLFRCSPPRVGSPLASRWLPPGDNRHPGDHDRGQQRHRLNTPHTPARVLARILVRRSHAQTSHYPDARSVGGLAAMGMGRVNQARDRILVLHTSPSCDTRSSVRAQAG